MPGEGVTPCLVPLATLLNHSSAAPHVVRYGALSHASGRPAGASAGTCAAAPGPGPQSLARACAADLQIGTEGAPVSACAAAVTARHPGPAPARGVGSQSGADEAGDALELRALRPCAAGEQVGCPAFYLQRKVGLIVGEFVSHLSCTDMRSQKSPS